MAWLGAAMMIAGALLGLLSGVGVARLPSTLARIHAAAKPASLGLALVALGAGVAASSIELVAIAVLVVTFQFLTAPISGHLLGRSVARLSADVLGDTEVGRADPVHERRWPLVLQTTLVWVILWRDLTLANVAAGVLVGVAVVALTGPRASPKRFDVRSALITLVGYTVSLVKANLRMAQQVVALRVDDLVETVVVCDLETRSQSVAFFDANAITFSPGTLTLEISEHHPYRMVVHALSQDAVEVNAEVADLEESAERMYR
jgi:multicomponent Na+:H+ antiporter subunit G